MFNTFEALQRMSLNMYMINLDDMDIDVSYKYHKISEGKIQRVSFNGTYSSSNYNINISSAIDKRWVEYDENRLYGDMVFVVEMLKKQKTVFLDDLEYLGYTLRQNEEYRYVLSNGKEQYLMHELPTSILTSNKWYININEEHMY